MDPNIPSAEAEVTQPSGLKTEPSGAISPHPPPQPIDLYKNGSNLLWNLWANYQLG
jgi:hypothetical protein